VSAFGEKKQKVKISYKCNFLKKDERAPTIRWKQVYFYVGYVEFYACTRKI
jgi:pectate lyase